jgi:hypothetical protein
MSYSAIRQSSPLVNPFSGEVGETRPTASWPLALTLLSVAVALIAGAAGYPNFFAAALDQLGAAAP